MTSTAVRGSVILTWHGPFSLVAGAPNPVWTSQVSARAGISLWTVPASGGFLVHRVRAGGGPLWQAQYDELVAFRRGEYPIHRAASLAAGRRDPLYRGLSGTTAQRARQQERFLNCKHRLEDELQCLMPLIAVFLAPVKVDRRAVQRLHAGIVNRVQSAGPLASAVLECRGAPRERMSGEQPLVVHSSGRQNLLGLVGEFEV